ncbi:uncharacterized protein LOC134848470 [Symsagittifera roscoffensis]|uniref:uncharacterized protein LOC134848470 n=1 Tax=Symsagittifera roscoffensis TaxID=84072 RepID=UPI00307C30C0
MVLQLHCGLNFWLFSWLLVIAFVSAREFRDDRQCPHLASEKVQLHMLEGEWYGVRQSVDSWTIPGSSNCSYHQFNFKRDHHGVGITWNETVCPYRPLARISSNCHSLLTSLHEHNANSNRGDLILDLFNLGLSTPGMPNMFILHVDKYFALVYYCVNGINNVKAEHSWVLSRLQFPNTRKLEAVEYRLHYFGLKLTMVSVNQDNCPNILPASYYLQRRGLNELGVGANEWWK